MTRRKDPIGLLKIKIAEAKKVANVETFRKSDPYAKVFLKHILVGRTRTKDNTLDPIWNETFFEAVYAFNDLLKIELWDENTVTKDRTLGEVEFKLSNLLHSKDTDQSISDNLLGSEVQGRDWFEKNKRDGMKIETDEFGNHKM